MCLPIYLFIYIYVFTLDAWYEVPARLQCFLGYGFRLLHCCQYTWWCVYQLVFWGTFCKEIWFKKIIGGAYWTLCCLVEYSFIFHLHLISECPGRYWPLIIWRSFMLAALFFYLFSILMDWFRIPPLCLPGKNYLVNITWKWRMMDWWWCLLLCFGPIALFFFSLQFYGLHSQLQIIWATFVCFILLYFRLYG